MSIANRSRTRRYRTKAQRQHPDRGGKSALTTVENAIDHLLSDYDQVFEEQIHILLFLGEIHALNTKGRRLTDATFQRDAYGVFSKDISQVLERKNLPQFKTYRGGHSARKFDTRRIETPDSVDSTEAEDVIDGLIEKTQGQSTDELANWCNEISIVAQARLEEEIKIDENSNLPSLDRLSQ